MPEIFEVDDLNLDAVLCFVRGSEAYFTTQKLEDQWGDDWNDRPYEYNAGYPYDDYENPPRWKILNVFFEAGSLEEPHHGYCNSPFSVEDINHGAAPWLRTGKWTRTDQQRVIIPAGTTLRDFVPLIEMAGGQVYFPISTKRDL